MAGKNRLLSAILGSAAVVLAGYSCYLYQNPESSGVKRQKTEESISLAYIDALVSSEKTMEDGIREPSFEEDDLAAGTVSFSDSDNAESKAESAAAYEEKVTSSEEPNHEECTRGSFKDGHESTQWSDPNYYTRDGITYTPDYAEGELLGVLEVDRAGIRRGVYGGSWEAIQHDLDIWMVTEARPDYEIGKTHFAIYGHNHTVQDLSFNRLKDVVPGDVFTYTTDKGVFIYDVTRFFADWREIITREYVDNFSISADKCYLISCGRNEYRYKDIVVEGTLRCIVDVKEYSERPSYYKYEYKGKADETEPVTLVSPAEEPEKEKGSVAEKTHIEVGYAGNGSLRAVCLDEEGRTVSCRLGLFDSDGLMITGWNQPEQSMPAVELADNADYVIGVLDMDEIMAQLPDDYAFVYHEGSIEQQDLYHEEELDADGAPVWVRPLFFAMTAVFLLLIYLLLFSKNK